MSTKAGCSCNSGATHDSATGQTVTSDVADVRITTMDGVTFIDVYLHDSNPEDFTEGKHPRQPGGRFTPTTPAEKIARAKKRGAPIPKGKALRPFRSAKRKPSPHENPSGPGRRRGYE